MNSLNRSLFNRLLRWAKDQIEYIDEDPWIRKTFEEELGKRGITSLMPEEAYRKRDFEWKQNAV